MLLRTALLLLLCMSTGMCATLGHYQAEAEEEEVPAGTNGVEVEAVEAAYMGAAEDGAAQVGDSPADEEPAASSLLAKIFGGDNPAADEPEVDVPITDGERPAGHAAAAAAAVEDLTVEAVAQEQPISPASSADEDGNDIQPVQKNQTLNKPLLHDDESSWSINSIRSSFQTMHGYFDSLVELVGGRDGVCQYRCRYGEPPQPRPGYQPSEPDGCRSSLVGFQVNAAFDLGIPAMTRCCNELDTCYESCGSNKYDCDSKFRTCLHGICSDLNKSLGFVSKVQGCESMADTLYNTVWTLGCRPYMNSQRAACVCEGEERDEL